MINKIALAGCGNVGTALLEILHEKRTVLEDTYGFKFEVTLVTDLMKGTVANPDGLDLGELLRCIREDRSFAKLPQKNGTFAELLDISQATMLAEATPTDRVTGEPGLTHLRTALTKGVSVTTTNKGPISLAYEELKELAKANGAKIRCEGTVMSGTPLIEMVVRGMAGCTVQKIEGILNGTTNFMLTRMEEGKTYAEALEEAQAKGYAEADPSGDVEGWDAAVKVSIMSEIFFGKKIDTSDIERIGITEITPEKIKSAKDAGFKVKLIAGIEDSADGFRAYVVPKDIPFSHPLATINEATNAITITTDYLGDVTLTGPGAGRKETGQALLTDLIAMA